MQQVDPDVLSCLDYLMASSEYVEFIGLMLDFKVSRREVATIMRPRYCLASLFVETTLKFISRLATPSGELANKKNQF